MNETDSPVLYNVPVSGYMPRLAIDDLRASWRNAVRSYNTCENAGLSDTCTALAEIIVKLSQQLDFAETMQEV